MIEFYRGVNFNDHVMIIAASMIGLGVSKRPGLRWIEYFEHNRLHGFTSFGMRLPLDNPDKIEAANDKCKSKISLSKMRIPILPYAIVDTGSPGLRPIFEKYVVKPTVGKQGNLVFPNILENEIDSVLPMLGLTSRAVILEAFAEGPTFRALVLNGKVIDFHETIPTVITGDGVTPIFKLQSRMADALLKRYDIVLPFDKEMRWALKKQGYDEYSVIPKSQTARLTYVSNISRGGGWRKVSDLSRFGKHMELSVEAARAVGLNFCGVDIIENSEGDIFVLEANPSPGVARFCIEWGGDYQYGHIDLGIPIKILTACADLFSVDVLADKVEPKLSVAEFNDISQQIGIA